jgi:ATP-dependent protease HslVU (ClpYQ) peptidase subunit
MFFDNEKIFKKKNVIIGVAGDVQNSLLFVDWFGSGKPNPKFTDQDFDCLVLSPSGLFIFDQALVGIQIKSGVYAIGSGAMAAMAAYICGKSLVDAVRVAAQVDNFTNDRVVYHELKRSRK